MFHALLNWTRQLRQSHPFTPGKVLEVGSMNINGTVRECFTDATEYIGIDARPGDGVDVVLEAVHIGTRWPQGYFDTCLAFECLEHDPSFWLTLDAVRRALRAGGMLIVTTPTFGFPEHRFPKDYFRFGADAFREVIFAGCELLDLRQVADSRGSPCLCGAGRLIAAASASHPSRPSQQRRQNLS